MPTGYTADVQDGTITEFSEFAMRCARAFGALVNMRDDPLDAEIPESVSAMTTYHDRSITKATGELERLESMTASEKVDAARQAWDAHVARIEDYNAKVGEERARYEAMLTQVRAWEPPTSAHTGLKEFMIEQLEDSMKHDCREQGIGAPFDPQMWWLEEFERQQRNISYHIERKSEKIQRARERTAWLRHLRQSLKGGDNGDSRADPEA